MNLHPFVFANSSPLSPAKAIAAAVPVVGALLSLNQRR